MDQVFVVWTSEKWSEPAHSGLDHRRFVPFFSGLNHFAGTNQKKVVRTVFVVQTTLAGLNHYFRFESGKKWYEPAVWFEPSGWFIPLFLVQTGNAGINQSKVV